MATIDNENGHTRVGEYNGANLFWTGREGAEPFILDIEAGMVSVTHGRAMVHISRDTIRQLADMAPVADGHLTALETWEEEQAYDAYCAAADVAEEQDRGDDL